MMPLSREQMMEAEALTAESRRLLDEWLGLVGLAGFEGQFQIHGILAPIATRIRGKIDWGVVTEFSPVVVLDGADGGVGVCLSPQKGVSRVYEGIGVKRSGQKYGGNNIFVTIPRVDMESIRVELGNGNREKVVVYTHGDYGEVFVYWHHEGDSASGRIAMIKELLTWDFGEMRNRAFQVTLNYGGDPRLTFMVRKALEGRG